MPRILALALFVLLLAGGTPAGAQDTSVLRIERDQGQMVRLRGPATSVFIANPDIADVQVMSPTMVYVLGKKPGETSLIALDAGEQVLAHRQVMVVHNLGALDRGIRQQLPGRPAAARSVDGSLLLTGKVANPTEAEEVRRLAQRNAGDPAEVINRLGVTGPTQVMLRVRVSEVQRDVSEVFGINWEMMANFAGMYSFGLASGLTDIAAVNNVVTRTPDVMNLFLNYRGRRWDINGLIDALAREGLVTILAEPNLVSQSGETASFLAGGEFPIPVPQQNGAIGIDFKQFGVSLAFTPTVVGNDRIALRVRPEVSQLTDVGGIDVRLGGGGTSGTSSSDSSGSTTTFRVPGLTTRRAETTIELGSGQSFAIAGLLQNNLSEVINKFPFLGDVPVLGTLFRSSRYQRQETELVIIVTPYIVRPAASPARLASPTDGLSPAGVNDRLLRGRLTAPGAGVQPVGRLAVSGPSGFILE
jgi:pilus assembly protein CpaC